MIASYRIVPRSLQNRLLLGILICMSAILIGGGYNVYSIIRGYLENVWNETLANRVSFYASTVHVGKGGIAYFSWWDAASEDIELRTNLDLVQMWYAKRGKPIPMTSPSLQGTEGLPRMDHSGEFDRFDDYVLPWSGVHARLCTRSILAKVTKEDLESGVKPVEIQIVVGRDLTPLHDSLGNVRGWFYKTGIVATGLILLAARAIIRRGVKPVNELAEKIERLPISSESQRISLSDAPSELNPVVGRLNALMDRVDLAIDHERQFASNAAHELRNPLAAIRATVEAALSRTRSTEEYEQTLDTVLQSQRGMQRVVDHLLLLARLESGHHKNEFVTEQVSLPKLLKKAWRGCFDLVEERRLKVTWQVEDPGVDIPLCASLFEIVVRNLFENATNYSPEGGKIVIKAGVKDGQCSVSVENDNLGLTADMQVMSFTPFWRADPNASGHRGNAGIGLALCRRIATTLGGTIDGSLLQNEAVVSYSIVVPVAENPKAVSG